MRMTRLYLQPESTRVLQQNENNHSVCFFLLNQSVSLYLTDIRLIYREQVSTFFLLSIKQYVFFQ